MEHCVCLVGMVYVDGNIQRVCVDSAATLCRHICVIRTIAYIKYGSCLLLVKRLFESGCVDLWSRSVLALHQQTITRGGNTATYIQCLPKEIRKLYQQCTCRPTKPLWCKRCSYDVGHLASRPPQLCVVCALVGLIETQDLHVAACCMCVYLVMQW